MFRFKEAQLPLAPVEEREAILGKQHSVFRALDTAFHAYLEVVSANPQWDGGRIEQEYVSSASANLR